MVSENTIVNNTTEKNLKLLDDMAWRYEWNGKSFETIRGYDNYFNEAKMIITELKKRNIDVKFYEELMRKEDKRIKLRTENYEEYKKQYENY